MFTYLTYLLNVNSNCSMRNDCLTRIFTDGQIMVFVQLFWHGKNDFAEKSKILLLIGQKMIFVGTLKIMNDAAKNFDVLATGLTVLHNYFDLNYFSDLYPIKILDLSAKLPFFP